MSDGGGSGAHVVTFAQTYTYMTDNGVDAQVVMKPAHRGTPRHADTQGCRVEARVEAGGRRQGQFQPCSQSIAPGVLSPSGGSRVRDGVRGVGAGKRELEDSLPQDGMGTAAGSSEIGLPAEPNSALC